MVYSYVTDATTALVIVFLLFILPSQPCCPSSESLTPPHTHHTHTPHTHTHAHTDWIGAGSSPRLLDWKSVQTGLPWNVVIVLGSGFALAAGAEVCVVCVCVCGVVCVCVCGVVCVVSYTITIMLHIIIAGVWFE